MLAATEVSATKQNLARKLNHCSKEPIDKDSIKQREDWRKVFLRRSGLSITEFKFLPLLVKVEGVSGARPSIFAEKTRTDKGLPRAFHVFGAAGFSGLVSLGHLGVAPAQLTAQAGVRPDAGTEPRLFPD
jgi:hypothetical protein